MRAGLIAAVLCVALSGPAWSQKWHTVEVTDGDSVTFSSSGLAVRMRGRIGNLDAPEMNGRCPEEQALAQQARSRLIQLVAGGVRLISELDFDQYGRVIVTQVINRRGQDVAKVLISEGLGREYNGKGPRLPWCPGQKTSRSKNAP